MAATFEVYKDKEGQYRWTFRGEDGHIIADSGEGYSVKVGAMNGIEAVKENASSASINDVTAEHTQVYT